MSELLLQGATMTNRHCDTCGDPIFRYQGSEFCPTCRAEGREGQSGGAGPQETPAQGQGQSQGQPQTQAAQGQSQTQGSTQSRQAHDQAERDVEPSRPPVQTGGGEGKAREPTRTDAERDASGSGSAPSGAFEDARADVVRAVSTMARRAEDAEDPRTAREYLAAAREAAEALAALSR